MLRFIKRFILLCVILPLSACFGVELDVEFHEDETVTITSFMSFSKDAFEMIGADAEGGACEGAETSISETEITCITAETVPLSVAMADGLKAGDSNTGNGMNAAIRRINDNVVAISLPLEVNNPQAQEGETSPEAEAMLAASFVDQNFRIWVTGKKILATNGTITEDGRSTLLSFPMIDVVSGKGYLPSSFEVVLEYR